MLTLTHYKCVGCKISNVSPIRYICFSSMNKKFFKCNPVRALMVSSTGTFVFCKSIVDDNITAADAAAHMSNNATGQGLTFAELSAKTNGNIKFSITKDAAGTKLIFKNNGGSGVEQECNVFIKASVKYGFGEVAKVVSVRVYPHGSAPQN